MSNAVQKWGICKTVCAQGCVGFPRAVLCSSSREFLERSLLPSPGTALTAGLLQPWRWKHNLCEARIPPTKGCWGKQTFKANLPRATTISNSCTEGLQSLAQRGELQALASRALGCGPALLSASLFPERSLMVCLIPHQLVLADPIVPAPLPAFVSTSFFFCFSPELYVLLVGFVLIVVLAAPGISAERLTEDFSFVH